MDNVKTVTTAAFSFFGILSLFFLRKKLRSDKNSEKWVHVGYLDEMLIHPVKGGKGKSVFLDPLGVQSRPTQIEFQW